MNEEETRAVVGFEKPDNTNQARSDSAGRRLAVAVFLLAAASAIAVTLGYRERNPAPPESASPADALSVNPRDRDAAFTNGGGATDGTETAGRLVPAGAIEIVMDNAPPGTPWVLYGPGSSTKAAASGVASDPMPLKGMAPGRYFVKWGWSLTHWPPTGYDESTHPVGRGPNGPWTSKTQELTGTRGIAFTGAYTARKPLAKAELDFGMTLSHDAPTTGADIVANSLSEPTAKAGVTPQWDTVWPQKHARTEFRPRSPVAGPSEKFWIFWHGNGDARISRGTEGVIWDSGGANSMRDAKGQKGARFAMSVDHQTDTSRGTVGFFEINVDTTSPRGGDWLSEIEIVHESYLGTTNGKPDPSKKCYRCIRGDEAVCSSCQQGTFLTSQARELAKYCKVVRFLEHINNANKLLHGSELVANAIQYDSDGRDWDDLLGPPQNIAMTVGQAYQNQIDTANAMNADLWLIFPTFENTNMRDALINAVEDPATGLKPGLSVYYEWSNEVWNGGFKAYRYAEYHGKRKACVDDSVTPPVAIPSCIPAPGFDDIRDRVLGIPLSGDANDLGFILRYQAFRTWDITTRYEALYPGSLASGRIRPVLSFQAANPGGSWPALTDRAYPSNTDEALSFDGGATRTTDLVYGIAFAYYPSQQPNGFHDAQGATDEARYQDYLAKLQADVDEIWIPIWRKWPSIARTHGLELLTYEGGHWDMNPKPGKAAVDATFYRNAHYHDIAYENAYRTWQKVKRLGVDVLMDYHGPSVWRDRDQQHGWWGIRETMNGDVQMAKRFQAFVDWQHMQARPR